MASINIDNVVQSSLSLKSFVRQPRQDVLAVASMHKYFFAKHWRNIVLKHVKKLIVFHNFRFGRINLVLYASVPCVDAVNLSMVPAQRVLKQPVRASTFERPDFQKP